MRPMVSALERPSCSKPSISFAMFTLIIRAFTNHHSQPHFSNLPPPSPSTGPSSFGCEIPTASAATPPPTPSPVSPWQSSAAPPPPPPLQQRRPALPQACPATDAGGCRHCQALPPAGFVWLSRRLAWQHSRPGSAAGGRLVPPLAGVVRLRRRQALHWQRSRRRHCRYRRALQHHRRRHESRHCLLLPLLSLLAPTCPASQSPRHLALTYSAVSSPGPDLPGGGPYQWLLLYQSFTCLHPLACISVLNQRLWVMSPPSCMSVRH